MEKRIFPRLTVNYPGKIIFENDTSNEVFKTDIKVLDITENGLGIISKKILPGISKFSIEIDMSPIYPLISQKGKTVWNNLDFKEKKFRYGISCISEEQDIYKKTIRELFEEEKMGYFLFELTVFLKDINMFGTTYFTRYFDWQGMAREAYFRRVKDYKAILSSGIKLITKRASVDYMHESSLFDDIIIKIQNQNIRNCSLDIIFTYINKKTGKIIAKGEETIVFTDPHGKVTRIPKGVLDLVNRHLAN